MFLHPPLHRTTLNKKAFTPRSSPFWTVYSRYLYGHQKESLTRILTYKKKKLRICNILCSTSRLNLWTSWILASYIKIFKTEQYDLSNRCTPSLLSRFEVIISSPAKQITFFDRMPLIAKKITYKFCSSTNKRVY